MENNFFQVDMYRKIFSLSCVISVLFMGSAGFAAAKLESLTVGYSTFAGSYAPLWVAVEEHLGAKYGLDLKAIYAGRVRPQQLLATGEVPIVLATGTGALTSHIVGVKDQVIVATTTTKVGTAIFSKPEIKSMEELKGKTLATGRPGAFLDATVRYVLRAKFNLVPDRDIKLLPSGEPQLSLQTLEHGVVAAAAMSTPYVFVARRAGYRELANFDRLGVEYPYTSVNVLRETLSKNPDLVDKFLKCIVEAIYIIKTNKPKTVAILKQYMKGATNEIIDDTYQYAAASLDEVPRPSLQVVKTALDMLSLQYPQAKQTDASLIIDAAFMNRIDQSGFIRSLYKK